MILKAYLGWANEGTHGGNSLRLYALDKGPSPRWAEGGGRTIERAILDYPDNGEGDRYLIVKLGDRFYPDEYSDLLVEVLEGALVDLEKAKALVEKEISRIGKEIVT